MKTVLLTGYAGFIGSQILRDLLVKKYNVIGVDNFSEGSDVKNFEIVSGIFKQYIGDISDPQIEVLFKKYKIDLIINCAAQSHVDRCWDQVDKFVTSNINGPLNLAKLALKYNIEKFVQVSTDEVHGGAKQPFTETSPYLPENAYASSKTSAEMLLLNYHKAFNLPLVITRGANTYGCRQKEKIIPLSIEKILKGEKIPLYKTPARRMWLHVEDHSSGIIAAMERGKLGDIYCLAPSKKNELYTKTLVEDICKILDHIPEEVIELVPDRPNYDLRYYMKNVKAKKHLNWSPEKNILEELKKVVDWYLQNDKDSNNV